PKAMAERPVGHAVDTAGRPCLARATRTRSREDGRVDVEQLVARARVVALPLRERFRGIRIRELLLLEPSGGASGWAEWSPFEEYEDAEAAVWLRAALE